ncbi:D-alanine--poly(phosphoribitol) ligase subunit DltC [Ruminococcus sp. OM05-10BH]|nr:D-alanine--poly(phosphoribitol) ligase subunit DltC [Ruminococcus sp. OM05-10BH]
MKETLFEILERICEDDIVKSNPDIDLFETDLMDSLGFAELLADIEDELGILIAPSEVDRSTFNTPSRILTYLETRSAS